MVDTTLKQRPDSLQESEGLLEESKSSHGKRRYVQVGYSKRRELLEMVEEGNITIKSAAERLKINYSNAKNIVKLYKKEHRIEKLPKKPSLTLREITCPPFDHDGLPFKTALLPFYDPVEAERFTRRNVGPQPAQTGNAGPPVTSSPLTESCTRASTSLPERVPSPDGSLRFNFLMYTPMILGRYLAHSLCSLVS